MPVFKNRAAIQTKVSDAATAVQSASRALVAVAVIAVAALILAAVALTRTTAHV